MESGTNGGGPSAKNLLFIMSDEHTRSVLGCYGNRAVHTPNLDQLDDFIRNRLTPRERAYVFWALAG